MYALGARTNRLSRSKQKATQSSRLTGVMTQRVLKDCGPPRHSFTAGQSLTTNPLQRAGFRNLQHRSVQLNTPGAIVARPHNPPNYYPPNHYLQGDTQRTYSALRSSFCLHGRRTNRYASRTKLARGETMVAAAPHIPSRQHEPAWGEGGHRPASPACRASQRTDQKQQV